VGLAHQCSRTARYNAGPSPFCSDIARPNCDDFHRQHGVFTLHPQTGWNPEQAVINSGFTNLESSDKV